MAEKDPMLSIAEITHRDHNTLTLTNSNDCSPEQYKQELQSLLGAISRSWLESIVTVSSTSQLLRSGFPFDEKLKSLGISQSEWRLFTTELVRCIRLTPTDRDIPIISALFVGATLSFIVGPFGPVMGFYTWRSARRVIEQENLLQSTTIELLDSTLDHWNAKIFQSRGLVVRLELPDDRATTQEEEDEFLEYFALRKSPSSSESRPVTKEYGRNLYWVGALDKPRLVITHLYAGYNDEDPPPAL